MNKNLFNQVDQILQEYRPAIQADGGDIELIKVEDGKVYIKLKGACVGCPMSFFTVKLGLERLISERLTEITEVIAQEDEDCQ